MIRKIILGIFAVAILIAGFIGYKLFRPAIDNNEDLYFYIKSGETLTGVKEELTYRQFLTVSGFEFAGKLLKYKKVKPGRYKLKDGMSLYQLVKMLRNGNQSEVKLVINKERTKELFAGKFGPRKKFDTEFDSLQMIQLLNNNDSLKKYGIDSNTVMSMVIPTLTT